VSGWRGEYLLACDRVKELEHTLRPLRLEAAERGEGERERERGRGGRGGGGQAERGRGDRRGRDKSGFDHC